MESPAGTQAVERAVAILELFDERRPDLSIGDVVSALDVHRSTASRMMSTLERHGLLEQTDVPGRYRLGLGLVTLAGLVLNRFPVRALARPRLREPEARVAYAFEDDAERRAALAAQGFTEPRGKPLHLNARDLTAAPEPPPLPAGLTYRSIEPADVPERVAIHQDVWAPSRVTESSYAQVRAEWPYRESLDCVVEAPDGRFAAYCMVWPDDVNRVGELEPVGVRSEYRRRGLGAAVCTFALRRWYDEGGRQAIVYCQSEPACALYAAIGLPPARHPARIRPSLDG